MRTSLHDILPPPIRERADKASFLPLMTYGLRERHRPFVEELLKGSELARRGYVNPARWKQEIETYLAGNSPLYSVQWNGLTMEMWLRHHMGQLPPIE